MQLYQLDDSHLGSVAATGASPGDAGVTAVALGIAGGHVLEQLVRHVFLGDVSKGSAIIGWPIPRCPGAA